MYEDTRHHPCYRWVDSDYNTFHPRVFGKDGFVYAQAAYGSRYYPLVCKRSDMVSKEELGLVLCPKN